MPRQALHRVLVDHRATEGFRSGLCFPYWGLLVTSTLLTTWTDRGDRAWNSQVESLFSQSWNLVERTQMKEVKKKRKEKRKGVSDL